MAWKMHWMCLVSPRILSAGEYVSTLVKAGEQGVGEPTFIRWSNTLSSLFVAHRKDDEEMWVSVVKRRS